MGYALQQSQTRRPQQQVVHHQAPQERLPARSATEAPGEDEHLDSLGNADRCAVIGLAGEGGGVPSAPPPGSMGACRELAAEQGPEIDAADLGVSLQQTEDFVLALGEQAVDRMARFEDASMRWYHLGQGGERYQQERALYVHDVRLYQALGLQARSDGAIVESVRRLVDEALLEASATSLSLAGQGLAGEDQRGGMILDPQAMECDLALVDRAFSITGFAPTELSLLGELEDGPGELMDRLEVETHGFSGALALMRARAVALRVDAVEDEKRQIEDVIATCDKLGEAMRRCVAGYRLGAGTAGKDQRAAQDSASDLLGEPHELPGALARAFYESELHALTARLAALTTAEEGWGEQARAEGIRDALGEYTLAVTAIDEHQESAQRRRDEYVARLGNLGRTMGVAAAMQGQALSGDAGQAMETLARIRVTHRSLVAVQSPLEAAMERCLQTGRVMGAASNARPPQAWLIELREGLGGPARLYNSVYHGLEGLQRQVNGRSGELEDISERFGAIMQRHSR